MFEKIRVYIGGTLMWIGRSLMPRDIKTILGAYDDALYKLKSDDQYFSKPYGVIIIPWYRDLEDSVAAMYVQNKADYLSRLSELYEDDLC